AGRVRDPDRGDVRRVRSANTHPRPLRRPPGGTMTATTTDAAALATIQAASRDLKLPMVRADAERIATDAQRSKLSYLAFLADVRRLSRVVARYGRLDLLCLDELGYVQLDSRGSELLFQILTEREEKSSVAVASNLPFSEWAQVIPDPRLVSAVIDRLTFNA